MSKFASLSFEPLPVRAPDPERAIKASVLKSGALKLTFNAGAYDALGKPDAITVQTATNDEGVHCLRITPAKLGEGWPVLERDAPRSEEGRPSGSCKITSLPFKPGVVHGAELVDAEWSDDEGGGVVVEMPDWSAMLARIEQAE